MLEPFNSFVVRRSIVVPISKIIVLQIVLVLLYIGVRLSKLWIFQQLFTTNDYHELSFWLGLLVFTILAAIQTVVVIFLILEWLNEHYELKRDVIVHASGVLRKTEDIYSLKTVEAGNVEQSIIGRIFDYGTIRIYSPVLKREYFLNDIPSPHKIRSSIITLLSGGDKHNKKIIPLGTTDL